MAKNLTEDAKIGLPKENGVEKLAKGGAKSEQKKSLFSFMHKGSEDDEKAAKASADTKSKKSKSESKGSSSPKKKPEKKKSADSSDTQKKKAKKPGAIKYLTGLLFAKMIRGGASELRANAETVNKLNVFPVPDGDTGDNMSMTIESGVAALESLDSDSLANVMKAASKGMLLGARGNSGVILSQFFAGIAKDLEETNKADAESFGKALRAGVDRAYASVMTPMEGTILSVARESVDYAISRITPQSTIGTLFSDLVMEMHAAVERTPESLAVLKEAGVVDSGGAGLFYIIDGLNKVLNGEEVSKSSAPAPAPIQKTVEFSSFGPDSVMTYGYCTELLVQLQNSKCDIEHFDIEALKKFLVSVGDSVVAFQTDSIVKIHVHTLTPDAVLAHLRLFGEFITVKIENMSIQHSELSESAPASDAAPAGEPGAVPSAPADENASESAPVSDVERKKYGIVAVASGDGIKATFAELGADYIVDGGQTNNPSTNDFIEAFDSVLAENIFVLPGNSNIVMAAKQAAEIYSKAKVYVVNAKSIGQSYVALATFNPEAESAEQIANEAQEAISAVATGYISPSIRDTAIDGVSIRVGDTIGVIGKEIIVSSQKRLTAACALLNAMLFRGNRFMLTVFCGTEAPLDERSAVEEYVNKNFPEVECYFLDGGQDIYPYLIVAE